MGRKRKVPVAAGEEKENEEELQDNISPSNTSVISNGPIYTIMSKIQLNETYHKKYIKELRQIYEKMDHDAFIYTFIKMIKSAMVADETNEFAHTTLLFCAKFVGSFEGDETHPLMSDTCRWLLTTISNNPHVRFRLCQFVNMILNALGQEATLDDVICDNILEYMVGRLVDVAPSVRVQAILAMQRLQVPDNPDDPVLRSYQYHLCSDPSPRVRQAVITCMGRNYHTIPYILDRLWDIDDKVRRHTYLHMSSFPVRSYKVSQRLMLLEQGLNDRNESVRKVVTTIMLQQWIESYQKDLVGLIGALKLDSNESELNRFRKIGKQVLKEIFKRHSKDELIVCLPLETEGEFYRCVPHDNLNIETAFYWQCLTEHLQNELAEELDLILPELSVFCSYVDFYCKSRKREMDKFEAMEFQYVLLSLMEILHMFDLGDEIGRGNLQTLLENLLKNYNLDEKVVEVIVKCAENLMINQDARHQFFLDIINDICGLNAKQQDLVHDRNLISELLANSTDAALNLKLSSLKVKILDLEEQEMNYVQMKDYVRAQQIIEIKNTVTEEFTNLLRPLLDKRNSESGNEVQPQFSRVVKNECILRGLQVTYYMVVSKRVKSLGHATCRLYNDFIFRNIASNQIAIRDWALKCGAAFSMLYEPLAKDVFDELYAQFFKNHNIRIWETAISCIFELLDRYGVDNFVVQEEQNKSKKAGRQLYNTLEFIDADEDTVHSATLGQGVGVIYMMSHFLDTCDDMCIVRAIIDGFCRLVLHGHIDNRDIIEKLLLRYFNPTTEPEINQILSVFLENLIQSRKQRLLQPCLMATVNSVLTAPYDSPLHDIRPETITHFIIDTTRPDALSVGPNKENSHNALALIFLNEMVNNSNNKELCKLLAKDLLSLEVNLSNDEKLKKEMKELADKIIQNKFDPKTVKNVIDFKDLLDGVFNPPQKRLDGDLASDDEEEEEDGTVDMCHNDKSLEKQNDDQTITNCLTENTKQDESNDNMSSSQMGGVNVLNEPTLVPTTAVPVSPTSTSITTTFGSENRTIHNLLRRRSRQSRNDSVDSNQINLTDSTTRPNKIRIEARIDSVKKVETTPRKTSSASPRVRRNLRYKNKDNITREKEPETIIEMILVSPSKQHSASIVTSPQAEIQRTSAVGEGQSTKTQINQSNGVNNCSPISPSSTKDKHVNITNDPDHTMANNDTRCNDEVNGPETAISEDLDTSEVIPASPTAAPLEKTMRLRATDSVRSMRSRTNRNMSQSNDKVVDSTPVRNGRKRVLRKSPASLSSASSKSISSPLRKQPCIEIDTQNIADVLKSSAPRTPKNNDNVANGRDTDSNAGVSPASDKENKNSDDAQMISNVENKTPRNKRENKTVVKTAEKQKEGPVVTTRNSAKKQLISKMIITRKRYSQENLGLLSPVHKTQARKSRIPVRQHPDKNSSASSSSPVKGQSSRSKRLNLSLAPSRLPRKLSSKMSTSTVA